MDDEQRPWWTRPPEPAPPAGTPRDDDPSATSPVPTDLFAPANPHARELFAPTDPYSPVDPYPQPPPAAPPAAASAGAAPPAAAPPAAAPPRAPAPSSSPTLPSPLPAPAAPPQAAPAPAPAPTRPVIRRVAVPQPPRSDETETLPAVDDDIFATFTGEIEQVGPPTGKTRAGRGARPGREARPGYPPTTGGIPVVPPADPDAPARRLPPVSLPDGRVLLLAGAGSLVVLLIVLVALITGRAPSKDQTNAAPTRPRPSTAASPVTVGSPPRELQSVDAAEAADELAKAKAKPGGTIVEAWSWTDNNGKNLVVGTSSAVANGKTTLKVVHYARMDTDKPRLLRLMRDPNLPDCGGSKGGTAGFDKNGMTVRDLNNDGIAEVLVGWWSRCGAEGSRSESKLAVISNGKKYIIRGQGVIGKAKSGSLEPAPRSSHWPDSYWRAAEGLFHSFYF